MANSNRHVNEPLRHKYADSHHECELWPILREHNVRLYMPLWGQIVPAGACYRTVAAAHTHHIFTNPRWDLVTNIIRLSAVVHSWCHEHLDESRVLCLYVKWQKGELDVAKLDEIRRASTLGFVELATFADEFAWIEPYRVKLLKAMRKAA